jgi:hypothetical protein
MTYQNHHLSRIKYFGALLVVFALLVTSTGWFSAQPALADDDDEAEVAVTLWAIPSIKVARGVTLAYKLRIENYGDATMAYARINFPYDRSKLTLVDTLFQSDNDFVESIGDTIQVYIGEVGKESSRFAVLYMRVADYLPNSTVINMWAGYDWEDTEGNYALDQQTNAAPVIVWDHNETSDYVWMTVDHFQAPVGTTFHFFSDRFLPGEKVQSWLKSPGEQPAQRLGEAYTGDADPNGRIHVHLSTHGRAPGSYELILRGERSDLEAVQPFTILPPS